ncbi:hypothetical protein GYMLUDRAFT_572535 [Collybiopsis luxurians FD-317 M1]|uniref:Mid2 domain-containing protein n=1 Tax=Collybiopsis luxurians FD-317 M1 TaxID=944289 RepID=A0A0D0BDC2_9AGAR|nr:hypothetical protein GYMLUDRAFT_572535 [Collybiopsis luxurians FD-317 M1]
MSPFDDSGLFWLLVFIVAHCSAQEHVDAITLWQFETGRLLSGLVTFPLEPLGTDRNGPATTYLYQALNIATITTINDAGLLTTETILSPSKSKSRQAPRTIVASASGWIEDFGSGGTVACSLVNSDFGDCVIGTSTANSGEPAPEALAVTQTILTSSFLATASVQTQPSSTLTSAPESTRDTSGKHSTAKIIGGTIGGCAVFLISLAVLMLLRRRRRTQQNSNLVPHPFSLQAPIGSSNISDFHGPRISPFITTSHSENSAKAPRKYRGRRKMQGRNAAPKENAGSTLQSSSSETETSYVQHRVAEIAERLRILEERRPEEPPPTYEDTRE